MRASTHTHTHTHTLTHVHQNPGTRAHPQGQFSQQLPSVQGPALIGIPPPCPPPCPLGGRVGRLPQGGPPGHTCCAPDPGLGLPAPPRLWAVGGSRPQQDGHPHHVLQAQPEYQPHQGLQGAFQFTAEETEAPQGTTQGHRAAVLASEDEPRPAQSPVPQLPSQERQGHVPWSHRVASEAGTEDALPVPCASNPSSSRRSQGSLNSAIPADSLPLVSALRHPPAAPSWAQQWGQPGSPPPAPGAHADGTSSEEACRPQGRGHPPRRTTRVGPLG